MRLLEPQFRQLRPARIGLAVVPVIGARGVEIDAADRAQPSAVGPAQHRRRERQRQRIARPGVEIEDPALDVRRLEFLSLSRLGHLARVDAEYGRRRLQAAHARTRQGGVEPQSQRVAIPRRPRDVEANRAEWRLDGIALAAEHERVDRHRQFQPAGLARAEVQPPEVERVSSEGHRCELSGAFVALGRGNDTARRRAAIISRVSAWFRTYGFADVLDNLLIGSYPLDAEDVALLQRAGVKRVLNLVEDGEYEPGERDVVIAAYAAAGIAERRVLFTDYAGLPADELEGAVSVVSGWLDQDGRTYLHCRAGWQRSPAIAAGVIAIREGIDVDEALAYVHERKPSADPLPQQREDLRRWWDEREAGD